MSEVRLTVGGREYTVACAEGEETHVTRLGETIDDKLQQMGGNLSPKEAQNLLFAALLLADDLHELRAVAVDADDTHKRDETELQQALDALAKAQEEAERNRQALVSRESEMRAEIERLEGDLHLAKSAMSTSGTWQGDPGLPPALERFADLLENCADKLEGKAAAS